MVGLVRTELDVADALLAGGEGRGALAGAEVKGPDASILRSRDEDGGIARVEVDLVGGPLMLHEYRLLLRPRVLVHVPDDHGAVGGRGGDEVLLEVAPDDVVAGEVEVDLAARAQVTLLGEGGLVDLEDFEHWGEKEITTFSERQTRRMDVTKVSLFPTISAGDNDLCLGLVDVQGRGRALQLEPEGRAIVLMDR